MFRRRARLTAGIAAALVVAGLSLAPGSASAAGGLTATFTKSSDWGTGYEATYRITNAGTVATTSWTLEFDLPAAARVSSLWEGTFTQTGTHVTVRNAAWNGAIAPGASVAPGFDVAYTGTFVAPANCLINGGSCAGGSAPPPPTGHQPADGAGRAAVHRDDVSLGLARLDRVDRQRRRHRLRRVPQRHAGDHGGRHVGDGGRADREHRVLVRGRGQGRRRQLLRPQRRGQRDHRGRRHPAAPAAGRRPQGRLLRAVGHLRPQLHPAHAGHAGHGRQAHARSTTRSRTSARTASASRPTWPGRATRSPTTRRPSTRPPRSAASPTRSPSR